MAATSTARAMSLRQVAAMLGLTKAQVELAEQKALAKLRQNAELREAWTALQRSHSLDFGLADDGRCQRILELKRRSRYKERDFLLNTIGQALDEEGAA
jgi:hypothetical protein